MIQGLLSIEFKPDEKHIEMTLIENAPHNQGQHKKFAGVAPNLVAFVCKLSFDAGFDGVVSFLSKTNLVDHYIITLGAESIFRQRMAIYSKASKKLVDLYFRKQ